MHNISSILVHNVDQYSQVDDQESHHGQSLVHTVFHYQYMMYLHCTIIKYRHSYH